MSDRPSSLEEAAAALRRQNYNVVIADGLLVARDIPYVTKSVAVERGVLAFPVELSSEGLMASGDHTAYFFGKEPCNALGSPLAIVANNNATFDIPGIGCAKLHLSRKKAPTTGVSSCYVDAQEKLETYISFISSHASRIDPKATAKTGGVPPTSTPAGPFLYGDTASARIGIGHLNRMFQDQRVGIIGLGGTGSYILDLIAKTHVNEIHLFDDDIFRSHNAFRAPGAASIEDIEAGEYKVDRFARIYSTFRTGILAHRCTIANCDHDLLLGLNFIFVSVDDAKSRHEIAGLLTEMRIPFIDVGLSANIVHEPSSCLVATIRTSYWQTSAPPLFENAAEQAEPEDDYSTNIQIAELNSLNATLAVIRWKKHLGYYQDLEEERMSLYNTNVQSLTSI